MRHPVYGLVYVINLWKMFGLILQQLKPIVKYTLVNNFENIMINIVIVHLEHCVQIWSLCLPLMEEKLHI